MTRRIQTGPRCGWPTRCTAPDSWHEPQRGSRHPWGYHDVQCQRPSSDPGRYPDCYHTAGHPGSCTYSVRPCQVRSCDPRDWPECLLVHGHAPPCHYRTLAEVNLIRARAGLWALGVSA